MACQAAGMVNRRDRNREIGGIFNWWNRGRMDILPRMTVPDEHVPEDLSQETWLAALPRKQIRAAEAALKHLPDSVEASGADLPLVIAAWSRVDPKLAARLLEQWIATADAQGNLAPPCVMVCQMVDWVAASLPDPDSFLTRILPGLARCVEHNFVHYDKKGTGLPLWPSKEDAWFPSEYAPTRFTVDLAVLLSNEAAALCRLAEGHPEVDSAVNDAEGEQRDLEGWLQEQFWNEEEGLFYRYEEGGDSIPDRSLCAVVPLVWRGRTAEVTEAIRPRTNEWKRTDWSPRSWILFFALLLHTSHHGVLAQMRAAGLPDGASELEAAVWEVLLADSERRQLQLRGEVPSAVHWLEAHRRHLRQCLAALGVVLLVGWLGWQIFHREHAGETGWMDLERRARQACEDGQHGRAAALYGQAVQQGPALYFRYRQAGEWMHLEEFEEAEKGYRAILTEAPDTPNAQINLALAVWRQGRQEEALEMYRAFAAENEAYPELAARAQLAVELIERQQALDRVGMSGFR